MDGGWSNSPREALSTNQGEETQSICRHGVSREVKIDDAILSPVAAHVSRVTDHMIVTMTGCHTLLCCKHQS